VNLPFGEIGGYTLIRRLGKPGGFGAAFEARHGGKRFVVKVFHADLVEDIDLERLRREVRAMEKLDAHPNIVPYVDSGEEEDSGRAYHYIVMPYIESKTLREVLEEAGGRLPPGQVRQIARQIATGLNALHEAGIVHRDLKPTNILICQDRTVRLLDFGVAKFLDYTSLTQHGQFVGTLQYAAPEQLRNETETGTDLWALGVVIYEMLAGRRPFRGQMLELMHAILNEDPELASSFAADVPDDLDRLVVRLLEKEPFDRPQTARDVIAALQPSAVAAVRSTTVEPYARDAAPILLVRGGSEAAPLIDACVAGLNPSGLVMPITERHAVGDVRRAAKEYGVPYTVDPLVFRLAFPNFSSVKGLRGRSYAPLDRLTPYQPEDLRPLDEARRVAHGAIDEQEECGADFYFSASFAIRDLDDKWLVRDAKLLELSLAHASAYGKPLIATLELPLEALSTPEAQIRLANRLARGQPSALLVNFDRLEIGSTPPQLFWAIRLMLLLQDGGAPALLGRAGPLRHLFPAFGIAGIEDGLGRYGGFRLSDFSGDRRPFGKHPPRFEFPSLLESLPVDKALAVLSSGLVPEADCDCRACSRAGSRCDQLATTYLHNAEMLKREAHALAALAPAERLERLERAIANARILDRKLRSAGVWQRRLAHLTAFAEAIALARPLLAVERLTRRVA
jgi:eukaryotic-like serine/threonine-protein kinase